MATMSQLLFLDCSPFGVNVLGPQQVLAALGDREGLRIASRSLAQEPLPPISAHYAQALTAAAPGSDPAFALSEHLIAELEACDALLISTPMYNCTVSASLKLWLDYVVRNGRSFHSTPQGKKSLLRDRPALVLVRSGSAVAGEDARQPDFLTPYLRFALSLLGMQQLQFVYLPGWPLAADRLEPAQQALLAWLGSFSLTGACS